MTEATSHILTTNETYLGDGLYASFDGWQIKLRAPRLNSDHEIFMEPDVFESFLQFAASLEKS